MMTKPRVSAIVDVIDMIMKCRNMGGEIVMEFWCWDKVYLNVIKKHFYYYVAIRCNQNMDISYN